MISQCLPRHRHEEFVAFLNTVDNQVPDELAIHMVLDNYAIHKHAEVKAWLDNHPPVPPTFHPDVLVVAEPGGAVVSRTN